VITAADLTKVCEEARCLGALIEAPAEVLPSCGENRGGLHVQVSPDGDNYVLTYSEKQDVVVLAESADASVILERAFEEITGTMASVIRSADEPPIEPSDLFNLTRLSVAEMMAMSLTLHNETSEIQLSLLERLNPMWSQRQATRNAEQLAARERHWRS